MTRRVVVTGMGSVLPGSYSTKKAFDNVVHGRSMINSISSFDVSDITTKIGGEILWKEDGLDGDQYFDPTSVIEKKELKKLDKFIAYGLYAAHEAIIDSGIMDSSIDKSEIGVLVGSGIGGIANIEANANILTSSGPRKISPFFLPSVLINLLPGQISMKYGFEGQNISVSNACATGTNAIGEGARFIRSGEAKVMIVGGAEASVSRLSFAGFSALRAMSCNNDNPQEASRPWDKDRDGFVMGEGAGILVLEDYESAKSRGAKIYAELMSYGFSSDAYHLTAPHPEGKGAYSAMKMALKQSGLDASKIDYINAHGTSTPLGDEIEISAVRKLFGDHISKISISSTKSVTGHLLGASGAVEAVFSIMSMNKNIVPPTINLHNPSESLAGVDLTPLKAKEKSLNTVMSNSFGFGGCNASVIFSKV